MKIADSSVAMAASHQQAEFHHVHERLEYWQNGQPSRVQERDDDGQSPQPAFRLEASAAVLTLSSAAQSIRMQSDEVDGKTLTEKMDSKSEFEVSLLKLLVEHITGRKIKVLHPNELQEKAEGVATEGVPQQAESEGFGLRYEYHEIHHEMEATKFQAKGIAKTEDGREISFNVELNMSREFMQQTHVQIAAGDALKDPLVLNFNGNAAELSQRDFKFDLDADGHEDQIAFVGAGSGFLALDKNGDGKVNDGSELFGPSSGDGFAELSAYDSDNNNWIDENDPVFDRLRIWSRDSSGKQQLVGLAAKGVGAIYLGHVATPFEMNDANNQQQGQLQSSGVFLKEQGGAGTIQQVDLVV